MSSRRSARSMTAATTVLIPLPSSAHAVRVDVTRHAGNNLPFAIVFPPGVRSAQHDFAFLSAGGRLQPYLENVIGVSPNTCTDFARRCNCRRPGVSGRSRNVLFRTGDLA